MFRHSFANGINMEPPPQYKKMIGFLRQVLQMGSFTLGKGDQFKLLVTKLQTNHSYFFIN